MRRGILVVSLFISSLVWADADYSQMIDLVGSYSLLSTDQTARVGGVITITADHSGVGYQVTPLPMASNPAPFFSSITPKVVTTLTTVNGITSQTATVNQAAITTHYQRLEGYVVVITQSCMGTQCSQNVFTFTRGKAPGVSVAPRDFIQSIAGHYTIVSAGGVAPTDINSGASVDLDSDEGSSDIWAPYCLSSSVCDPGEITIPYANTQVFLDGLIYTILVERNNQLFHYSWESFGGEFVFRNFQYTLPGGSKVCLEHIYKSSPEQNHQR